MALRLGDGVERLPGIGPARARSLEKLGLATVEDLLRYFPRDYEDRRRFSTVAAFRWRNANFAEYNGGRSLVLFRTIQYGNASCRMGQGYEL